MSDNTPGHIPWLPGSVGGALKDMLPLPHSQASPGIINVTSSC